MAPSSTCKTALLGAAGGIGQPLALLLKQSQVITELALYDIVPVVHGVAADISHINTPSVVTSNTKDNDGIKKALEGANLVVIPAGVPRKPGMTRDDLFKINASIVRDLALSIAEHCPTAFICVISNPVNSTVPIVAEVLRKKLGEGNWESRVFGVTTLDVVRASTFAATSIHKPLESSLFRIPVIGGHSGTTIIPVLSQSSPALPTTGIDIPALVNRIQFGGDEVVKAKDGAGSATLSMAYAGYRFVNSLIEAVWENKKGVTEMAFIYVKGKKEVEGLTGGQLDFFSLPVELGPNGVEKVNTIQLNDYEKELLGKAVPELQGNISKGVTFVTDSKL